MTIQLLQNGRCVGLPMPIDGQIYEYLRYCKLVRRMSPATIECKYYVIRKLVIDIGLGDLRELDNARLNAWVAKQTLRGVTAATINTRLAHILAMVRYHREMGLNVPLKLPLVRKLRTTEPERVYYDKDEIDRVLTYATDKEWLMVKICFDAGLRIGELARLKLSNFSGRRIIFVGKGGKLREAYITGETRRRLDKYIFSNNITDSLWVHYIHGVREPYTIIGIRYIMGLPFRRAGYDNFYPHALRHSFATDIQRRGATLLEMQQMLGHSSARTTERYIHALDGQMKSLFEKYRS